MTVSSSTDRAQFAGNGVATVFPLPFRFFSNGNIFASLINDSTGAVTPIVLGVNYSLIGAGLPEQDGNAESVLTMFVAPAIGFSLFVQRVIPLIQATDIVNQGRFLPEIHEDVFDRLTMIDQQNSGKTDRAIRVSDSDPVPSALPSAAARAGLLMGFDSAGNPIATGLAAIDADTFAFNQGQTGSFWADDVPPARIHRFADRVLVGDAVVQNGNKFPGMSKSWVGFEANGFMSYFDSRSQMQVVNAAGSLAIATAARTSDNMEVGNSAAIGLASYVHNDASGKSAWNLYGHARHGNSGAVSTLCIEVDIANTSGVTQLCHPYLMGANGISAACWLRSGGETAESGIATAPASVALGIARTASSNSTFDKGIVFQANAITGADGVTGTAPAIEMGKGHLIRWVNNTGAECSVIYSNNTDNTKRSSIQFESDAIWMLRNSAIMAVFDGSAGSGNYVQLSSASTGASPGMKSAGVDANIDMTLDGKGTGRVQLRQATAPAVDVNTLTVSLGAQAGSAGEVFRATRNGSSVNYINATGGASGTNPGIVAAGSDANIDLALSAKGTGLIRFGTWTTNADVAINGYIKIKDASGTTRKLATIA